MMRAITWLAIAGATVAGTAQAQTTFSIKQITVPQATAVAVTGISPAGDIIGDLVNGNGEYGFILKGRNVTLLPSTVPGCTGTAAVYPSAMNASGQVAGAAECSALPYGFTYNSSGYTSSFSLGALASEHLFVGIDALNRLAFNYHNGREYYTPYISTRFRGYKRIALPEYHALVRSMNDHNLAAGTATHDCGTLRHCVFAGDKRKYRLKLIYPPGAATASGGYINDHDQVAGVYATAIGGNYAGFVYDWKSDTYTTFDAPGTAYTMNVYGNNKSGRVVGIYGARDDTQHGFLYNGSTVTSFGDFPAGDEVSAAINDHGVIVVRDIAIPGPKVTSYRITCSGPGC